MLQLRRKRMGRGVTLSRRYKNLSASYCAESRGSLWADVVFGENCGDCDSIQPETQIVSHTQKAAPVTDVLSLSVRGQTRLPRTSMSATTLCHGTRTSF